ncbi:hypothetical protein BGAL_0362g00100 [Botrytis galanthina]|uniref:C2H2-type domain-containing protein n=1 Tax=Botrytis galanthina TaxID=278940 RepID=A0A4S8QPX7_9HELO|nr:hypothetical protein BGAL_0362g00100 [Botrytis galanthina]
MSNHDNLFTIPTWEEQYIYNPALDQEPESPVAYAPSLPPRFQHQDPVITQDYTNFAPASITETAIQPTVQVYQPYAYSYTDGPMQHGSQTQQFDSGFPNFDRPNMSVGIEPQEASPLANLYQQQVDYTPTYTTTHAPFGEIPFEQPAASLTPNCQTTTHINAWYDTDASSDVWSPGVCPHASCLAKPLNKQKNYREHSDWRSHWSRVHEKQHQCLFDGSMFGTANELKRHNEAKHQTGDKRHSCQIVGCQARAKKFNRKDKFREHNDRWHGPYCCPVPDCNRGSSNGYKEERLLMDHMRSFHNA